ncbi:sensor histidine kinase [Mangrovactinospora gilvigrisea]|uniref:sensor histidine kinase n=1 Tax=Mangrovactinospora gilvigrisea TaxID=1428644 RepID=UPI001FE67139|nr:sensor histidine kinase [Mangrovactinospora gilvigrisea]
MRTGRDGTGLVPTLRRWDWYYGLALAATIAYLLCPPTTTRVVSAALLVPLVPLYLLVGRPAMARGEAGHDSTAARLYLTAVIVLFIPAAVATPTSSVALFAIIPQCFILLQKPWSLVAVFAANGLPLIGWLVLLQVDAPTAVGLSAMVVLDCAFSIVFGTWIEKIIEQSEAQRRLLDELRSSRAEVARLSAAQGALKERERLAREIHDTLAQGFTSLLMLAQAVDVELESGNTAGARRHAKLMDATARENLAEARDLVAAMTPARLEEDSLEEAVRRLGARLADETGAEVSVAVEGATRPLPPVTAVVALRACQEALANVRKHAAGARSVRVRLGYPEHGGLRLVVADDGCGFDPSAYRPGYGLPGMRARAAETGGRAEVRSVPGEGTTVEVLLEAASR